MNTEITVQTLRKLDRRRIADLSTVNLGDLAIALEIVQAFKRGTTASRTAPEVAMGHCPRCDLDAPVEVNFGWRTVRGKVIRQSWCRTCRAQGALQRR